MPKLSHFYGIDIYIPVKESNHWRAHFHAGYAGKRVSLAIDTLEVLAGRIPPKELAMVRGWAFEHRAELLSAWEAIKGGREPNKITGIQT